jgi:hypothetical protein
MSKRLVVKLTVDYDIQGNEDIGDIATFVEQNIRHMIGDGGLSGCYISEVDGYSVELEIQEDDESMTHIDSGGHIVPKKVRV